MQLKIGNLKKPAWMEEVQLRYCYMLSRGGNQHVREDALVR